MFVVEGPTSLCSCFKSFCHCCAGRDIIFRIVELKTGRQVISELSGKNLIWQKIIQVGSISKKWSGILKEVLTKADRFSIDFPPDIGKYFCFLKNWFWEAFKNAILCFVLAWTWPSGFKDVDFFGCFPYTVKLDIGMKATLLGMTFLIDYLHFEADPTDDIGEDTP